VINWEMGHFEPSKLAKKQIKRWKRKMKVKTNERQDSVSVIRRPVRPQDNPGRCLPESVGGAEEKKAAPAVNRLLAEANKIEEVIAEPIKLPAYPKVEEVGDDDLKFG
jgi:hypothetical protein